MNGIVGNLFCHFSTIQLDSISVNSLSRVVDIQHIGCVVQVGLASHILGIRVGNQMLNLRRWEKRKRTYLTKLVNWLIERLSLFGVINHNVQTTTSNALHMKC